MSILNKSIATLLGGFSLLTLSARAATAYTFTLGGLTYSQDFDIQGADASVDDYAPGWAGAKYAGTGPLSIGAPITTTSAPSFTLSDGSGNSGTVYNVGTNGSTDRALGSIASGTTIPVFGASFLNGTNATIVGIDFTGMLEQWRSSTDAAAEKDSFEFSLDATSLTDGTWSSLSSFNLAEIVPSASPNAKVNGDDPVNQAALSASASGLNWSNNTTLWIRWRDEDNVGSDALLAIDNFGMTVHTGAPPRVLTYNPPGAAWNTDSANKNWLDGSTAASFATGDTVNFTDTGLALGSNVIIDAAGITAGGVNVSNTAGTYTFTGGAILGNGSLTKTNAGTLVLGNAGNAYTGPTVISGGEVRSGSDNVIPDGSSVTVNTGTTFNVNGFSDTVGSLTVIGGTVQIGAGALTTGGITLTEGTISSTGAGRLLPTANLNVSAGATPSILNGAIDFGSTTHTISTLDGAADEDLVINATIAGGARITLAGEGSVRLNADNSNFGGGFRVNAPSGGLHGPTVIIGNGAALGTAQFFFNGGTLSASTPVDIITPFSVGGNVAFSGADMTLSGGFTSFGDTPKTYSITNTVTITASIAPGTATGSADPNDALVKAGTGTLILTAPNAYNDGTQLLEGTLEARDDAALGAGQVIIAPSFGQTATLRFTSSSPAITSLAGGFDGTSVVVLGGLATNTTLNLEGIIDATFAGAIENGTGRLGSIIKSGPAVQSLDGANTYTGSTTVSEGTLSVSGSLNGTSGIQVGGAPGATAATFAGRGTTTLATGGQFLVNSSGTLAPGETFNPTGTLSISGTTLPAGTLRIDGALALDFSSSGAGGSAGNPGLNDAVSLAGSLVLGANATLSGTLLQSFATSVGDLYFILLNDGVDPITGHFAGLNQNDTLTIGSIGFTISYTGDSTSGAFSSATGNDIVLRTLTTIPEPGSAALLVGTLGFLGLGRIPRNPLRNPGTCRR